MVAATAAAMSDPDRNPWFRRRWQEHRQAASKAAAAVPPRDPLDDLTGLALLDAWRRERAREAEVSS